MKKIISLVLFCLVYGCINITVEPSVQTVRQWEGHYRSTNDFHVGTHDMELKDGESVWVLSNSTLARLLKEIKDK